MFFDGTCYGYWKREEEDKKKKKSIAFKASSSSSKNKGKSKKESSDDDDLSDIDDEAMALFVRKMEKFMKKKGYGARKRRDHTKSKEYVRRRSCIWSREGKRVREKIGSTFVGPTELGSRGKNLLDQQNR